MHSQVVLLARVDDLGTMQTLQTLSVVQAVEHDADETPAAIVEMALELAPPAKEWARY